MPIYALCQTPSTLTYPTPLPSKPTLFPYTTLFRSSRIAPHLLRPDKAALRPRYPRSLHCGPPCRRGFPRLRSEEQRLNSSHITISYAVFCLKKKKKKHIKQTEERYNADE